MLHVKAKFKVKGHQEDVNDRTCARRVGVRPSALRYYEAQGIVRPAIRQLNGYRTYTSDAVKLLLFVKRAQALGISLKEIKPLVDLIAQGQPPCNHVKGLARRHLSDIDDKIRELQSLQSELRALLRRKIGRPHGDEVRPIIQSM